MHRLTVRFTIALTTIGLLAVPAGAHAAGCEVLTSPGDRARCVAREQARDAAREEVRSQVRHAAPDAGATTNDGHTAAWTKALAQSDDFDASTVVEPRPIAAVIGLAWLGLVLRARWRARRRGARA
jgi:hypothetical protein